MIKKYLNIFIINAINFFLNNNNKNIFPISSVATLNFNISHVIDVINYCESAIMNFRNLLDQTEAVSLNFPLLQKRVHRHRRSFNKNCTGTVKNKKCEYSIYENNCKIICLFPQFFLLDFQFFRGCISMFSSLTGVQFSWGFSLKKCTIALIEPPSLPCAHVSLFRLWNNV